VTRFVVDASVAAKWFVPEHLSGEARDLLAGEHQLLAPELLWVELANVLWKKHRRRALDGASAMRILRDFASFPVEAVSSSRFSQAALGIAIRHQLTAYDSLYLAVAAGHACRLVTADRRLYEVCGAGNLASLLTWLGEVRG